MSRYSIQVYTPGTESHFDSAWNGMKMRDLGCYPMDIVPEYGDWVTANGHRGSVVDREYDLKTPNPLITVILG
jgi:hypothetical protein